MALTTVVINAKLSWRAFKARGGRGNWIAVCEPLGLTIESERYSELAEDVGDAIDLMFRDLLRNNDLDRFLRQRGWTRGRGALPVRVADARFDVPFDLLVSRSRGGSAASLR